MKVVILAGGFGTRLSEETVLKPKPMVEIGGLPILWHIMKIYSAYGHNEFIICLGYKGYIIKEYFANYFLHMADVTFDLAENQLIVHRQKAEPWKVTLVDTGGETMTGGRLKRIGEYIDEPDFMATYGDGVADIDISSLVDYHFAHGKMATMTTVQPSGRFGAVEIESDGMISRFREKPIGDQSWINGGFFVLRRDVLSCIDGDKTVFERDPLERLAAEGELHGYRHGGFWMPMDTMRDKKVLEKHWESGHAPWKVWESE